MQSLVSSAAALAADRAAESEYGYPALLLMEEAGLRLQDRLEALQAAGDLPSGPMVYLAGPGNNGGDALVMARQAWLRGRRALTVVLTVPPRSASCRWQVQVARQLGLPLVEGAGPEARSALASAALWVDGISGAGQVGPLRPTEAALVAELAAMARSHGTSVAALDLPSGLYEGWSPEDGVLRAALTLVPGWAKTFAYEPAARACCGRLVVVPLAFPRPAASSATLLEPADLAALLPRLSDDAHKGTRGHVLLAGGAAGMTGALVLAARSAAAAGAGLVTLAVDADLAERVAAQVPAFQVRGLAEVPELSPRYSAVVAGPGWGRDGREADFAVLHRLDLPLVVDADALAPWAAAGPRASGAPVVLTPHPGEFVRLGAGSAATPAAAAALASLRQVTVILKGAVTWILAPDGRRAVWDGRNPALGTGGSGDCLAGFVGALLGLGLGGFEAAQAAVVLHGVAGAEASAAGWFTAERLPETAARLASACMLGRAGL